MNQLLYVRCPTACIEPDVTRGQNSIRVLIISILAHKNAEAEKVGTSGDSNVVTNEEKKEPGAVG